MVMVVGLVAAVVVVVVAALVVDTVAGLTGRPQYYFGGEMVR